jgi:hypothetical protein
VGKQVSFTTLIEIEARNILSMKLGVNQFEAGKIEMLFRRAQRASNMQYI